MKVAFVSQPWDTLSAPVESGSIPIWTYEIAKRLKAACQVVIYARRSEGQVVQEISEGIEFRRVSTVGNKLFAAGCKAAARIVRNFRYLSSQLYCLPYFMRVAADLKRQQCDIVHIHNFSQAVPIIRRLNPKIKIVLHMHCEWLTQFDRQIMARRLAQCDLIIGCSDYITGKVKSAFPQLAERCQRVYNGVDIVQFKTERTSCDRAILFVGRISPEKGLHTLIDAFDHVVQRFPDAQLQIVGPNKPTTAEFIADLSEDLMVQRLALLDPPNYLQRLRDSVSAALAAHISFVGQISHLQLQEYFQRAAVLVNPSLSEAFGMSLIEAMASGVPVVATRLGGMVDVVQEGETGLLVPADNPSALAAALEQLLEDEPLRREMGEKGRSRAETVFAWEVLTNNLHAHYQSLYKSPPPSLPPSPSGASV